MVSVSYPRLRLYTQPKDYKRVVTSLLSRDHHSSDDIKQAETAIKAKVGRRHAILMPRARSAIYLTLKHVIRPGQKVILSPYTITDVINMVSCAGGIPVFADIDRKNFNLDPQSVKDRLAEMNPNEVGAVMATHFYGGLCDIEAISEICMHKNIPLIEDCAQAFGFHLNGRQAGSFGLAGIFSFGLYKNVTSFIGGAVVTDDDNLAKALREEINTLDPPRDYFGHVAKGLVTDLLTWPLFFKAVTFHIFRYGFVKDVMAIKRRLMIDLDPDLLYEIPQSYLYRPTALQARLIVDHIGNVESNNAARRERAKRYYEGLSECRDLIVPQFDPSGQHIYTYYVIQHKQREDLVRAAMLQGRDMALNYHRNCASVPCFSEFGPPCPHAEMTAKSAIYLATYPSFPLSDVDKNINSVRNWISSTSVH